MFHPPKIPQQQWNNNKTGLPRVPIANPLKANVAPIADPFFQPLLAVVDPAATVQPATGFINLLNLKIH